LEDKEMILKDTKVVIMIVCVLFSILAIGPRVEAPGVEVIDVEYNSSGWQAQIKKGFEITSVDGEKFSEASDFYAKLKTYKPGDRVKIVAEGKEYYLVVLNETPRYPLGIEVAKKKRTNLRFGLDLDGGTRVLAKPIPVAGRVDKKTSIALYDVILARLNAYGLRDVKLRNVELEGEWYLQAEMAGAGSSKIVDIITNIGKFEVRIINRTVATGQDIVMVGAVEAQREGGYGVPFTLTGESAKKIAAAYKEAAKNKTSCALAEDCPAYFTCSERAGLCRPLIEMYLNDELKYSAPPAEELHVSLVGGLPTNQMVARMPYAEAAKMLEIVMKSGTIPPEIKEIEIVSRDFIDPHLGREFLSSALFAGLGALVMVSLIIFVVYKKAIIASMIMCTSLAEVVILLGLAAFLRQDLDLLSLAGIIVAVGTGVDQQIIMTDEILEKISVSIKRKMARAFGIIVLATSTTMATMFPLMTLGVGVVRGFALMTFLGVLIGVLITRPAYGRILCSWLKNRED
jgi:preprotein translocase subunit SecD